MHDPVAMVRVSETHPISNMNLLIPTEYGCVNMNLLIPTEYERGWGSQTHLLITHNERGSYKTKRQNFENISK